MESRDEIGRALKPAVMVSAVILASLVVYLGLVLVIQTVIRPFNGFGGSADMRIFRFAPFYASAAIVALLLILRRHLFKRRAGEDVGAALLRFQRAALLTMVLSEGPAIIGLVMFFIGGNAVNFYLLLLASIVLAFIHFPRRGAWEEWLKG